MYTVFIHDHEFLELSSYNYKIILRYNFPANCKFQVCCITMPNKLAR